MRTIRLTDAEHRAIVSILSDEIQDRGVKKFHDHVSGQEFLSVDLFRKITEAPDDAQILDRPTNPRMT